MVAQTWPIIWPKSVDSENLDPNIKRLCEVYASACMTSLTLGRVGGAPVTVTPAGWRRHFGHYASYNTLPGEYIPGRFFYGAYPSAHDLKHVLAVFETHAIALPGPVAGVTEIRINGAVLDSSNYRVEDGKWLVRMGGGSWPCDEDFTVTYLNSHPVDEMGSHAAGVMAAEWLKLLTTDGKKNCRLSASATSVSRQGITMELTTGMFPEGVTGIPEIDAYLMLFNPFGVKVAPRVYSPDLPQFGQVL